jgi:hypothetical protein
LPGNFNSSYMNEHAQFVCLYRVLNRDSFTEYIPFRKDVRRRFLFVCVHSKMLVKGITCITSRGDIRMEYFLRLILSSFQFEVCAGELSVCLASI